VPNKKVAMNPNAFVKIPTKKLPFWNIEIGSPAKSILERAS
jgi:hypothetical protein